MTALPSYAEALVREFELPRLGTLGLRARVFFSSGRLTRQLADGVAPVVSRELALRSRQITDGRTLSLLAATIDDLLAQAEGARAIFNAQPRIDPAKLTLARVPLVDLAERLRIPEPVTPRGMALVFLLLTDPAAALHGLCGAGELAEALVEARLALDAACESRLEL